MLGLRNCNNNIAFFRYSNLKLILKFKISIKKNRRIRKKLGLDQASETFSASAPLQKETFDYFQSLGITLCEIYGSTETLGVQTSYKPGQITYSICLIIR